MIERIEDSGKLMALIIRNEYNDAGLNFITNEDHSFQVGVHNVKQGKRYRAHKSLPFTKLENFKTNKIYYMKEGKAITDIYNLDDVKVGNFILNKGDMILFIDGAHGITMSEDSKMIEIKQGPYRGVEEDKIFLE